jgi:rubrerythrin
MRIVATQSAHGSDARREKGSAPQNGDLRSSPACFRLSPAGVIESRCEAVQLSARNASALAELLQVLSCGEESAALTFDHLSSSSHERSLRSVLAGIAADEREHQALLAGLRACLPQPLQDSSLEATMRRFFIRLADREVLVHFVRIVAIDSAVCQILGALRCRGRPLASDVQVCSILERIHQDEARHVAIASRCATPLLKSLRGRDITADAREQLTEVLRLRASALDSLEVDPDQLFVRLRVLPRLARESSAY